MNNSKQCRRLGYAALTLGLVGLGPASTTWAQSQDSTGTGGVRQEQGTLERLHREAVSKLYGSPAWTHGILREGLANRPLLKGWTPGALSSASGHLTRTYRQAQEETPSFVLETFVAKTVDASHATLLTWLSGLQSSQRMPEVRELGIDVGDVGFVGKSGAGPRAIAWIGFVRGNVAVRISTFDARRTPELDLASLARSIDGEIMQQKALATGATPLQPALSALVLERTKVVAGENLRIDFHLDDPAGANAHLRWVVGGPGQGYVERDAAGDWHLHTTGPGKISLTLQATGSQGGYTERTIELQVADD